jgi:hypothetical protein
MQPGNEPAGHSPRRRRLYPLPPPLLVFTPVILRPLRRSVPRYEDYLNSQITGTDMYYLEDEELARHLVELG